jgi:hypothetical protein
MSDFDFAQAVGDKWATAQVGTLTSATDRAVASLARISHQSVFDWAGPCFSQDHRPSLTSGLDEHLAGVATLPETCISYPYRRRHLDTVGYRQTLVFELHF